MNILVNGNNMYIDIIYFRLEHIQQKDKIFINEIKSGIYSVS
jgi:hypothetical protein